MTHHIVIAEDETVIRNNLARLLRIEGYEVVTAANGREALALILQDPPDLVLSDVMMPEMTGHQLLTAMRADPHIAHIPAVLLTARAERADVREGMNLGADDYLTKPFQRDELLTCIRSQLDKASVQKLASQRLAAQAHRIAHYDPVTDLPNKTHFMLLLSGVLGGVRAADEATPPALWVVGMDNLPQLSEVLGAGQLDNGIQQLAQRLVALTSSEAFCGSSRGALVARLGEDRLGVLAPRGPTGDALDRAAVLLLDTMGQALVLGGMEHFPTVSVGACAVQGPSSDAQALLNRLDITLAVARAQAGKRLATYRPDMAPALSSRLRLHNDLHRVVVRGELESFFQPQVLARDSSVTGFEALIRWRHPEFGVMPPARFIPLAEDNGQIVRIGAWMLTQSCLQAQQCQALRPADWPAHRVAVNLSARQFADPGLMEHVREALEVSGLPPELLELEITESTAMHDLQRTLDLLRRFKGMGLMLAIDDFGTGYSSLAYLKRFPLDILKIDQSFVRQLCTDREDQAIASAVIHLAHSLGLRVVAEGVETTEQHALLLDMGCDLMQGFLHARPLSDAELRPWLVQHFAMH
ncbi:MAG: hypothetical protein RLZZ401_353 [Pseudomonadota bacterium]